MNIHTTHRFLDIVLFIVDDIFLNLSCKSGYIVSLSLAGEHRFPINTTHQQATTIIEICVETGLSVWVRHYFSTSFSLYFFLSLSLSLYFYFTLYVCMFSSTIHSFSLSLSLSLSLCLYASIFPFFSLSIFSIFSLYHPFFLLLTLSFRITKNLGIKFFLTQKRLRVHWLTFWCAWCLKCTFTLCARQLTSVSFM